jgi:hypothetical protein
VTGACNVHTHYLIPLNCTLKKIITMEPAVVLHTCNPSTWGGSRRNVNSKASLDYIVRPYLKKAKGWALVQWKSTCLAWARP